MKYRTVLSTILWPRWSLPVGVNPKPTDDAGPGLVIGGDGTEDTVASIYQMPTPNELFNLVRDLAGEGQKRMLNPASNVDRYVSLKSRAFNFGVYSTDLVYASYFKLNVEVARYYLTMQEARRWTRHLPRPSRMRTSFVWKPTSPVAIPWR